MRGESVRGGAVPPPCIVPVVAGGDIARPPPLPSGPLPAVLPPSVLRPLWLFVLRKLRAKRHIRLALFWG
eukprot:373830-Rhodomonas_salina.1